MPAESERLARRIGRRDRWFLGLAALAAAAGVLAALILSRHGGSSQGAGCVAFSHPDFTGAATYRYCGARAAALCRRPPAGEAEAIAVQCERLGLAPSPR